MFDLISASLSNCAGLPKIWTSRFVVWRHLKHRTFGILSPWASQPFLKTTEIQMVVDPRLSKRTWKRSLLTHLSFPVWEGSNGLDHLDLCLSLSDPSWICSPPSSAELRQHDVFSVGALDFLRRAAIPFQHFLRLCCRYFSWGFYTRRDTPSFLLSPFFVFFFYRWATMRAAISAYFPYSTSSDWVWLGYQKTIWW